MFILFLIDITYKLKLNNHINVRDNELQMKLQPFRSKIFLRNYKHFIFIISLIFHNYSEFYFLILL